MSAGAKRIVAVVLPQLACELARQRATGKAPIAVVLTADEEADREVRVEGTASIDAVSEEARRAGIRVGQRVSDARARLAGIAVHRVSYAEIDAALGRVAEIALTFGPTAAIALEALPRGAPRVSWGSGPYDTVWLDVTGAAHLAGGEEALLEELEERIAALGHSVRLALAGGPRIAQSLARWAPALRGTPGSGSLTAGRHPIAGSGLGESARAMASLPVQALPVDPDTSSWLIRIGVITIGDLTRLPRTAARSRLGERASEIMDLAMGRDHAPLLAYTPPRIVVEETRFEDGVEVAEALLFALRGMTSRAAVRLAARGEACSEIDLAILIREAEPVRLSVQFPGPLSDEADLLRALKVKLERVELPAPATGLRLTISKIAPSRPVQLDLSRDRATDPDRLPALLAELSAEIGADRVGVLAVRDAHRPEARSELVPAHVALGAGGKRRGDQLSFPGEWSKRRTSLADAEPARLLSSPIPLGKIGPGAVVAVDPDARGVGSRVPNPRLFAVERLSFVMRLDGAWWTKSSVSRDYARVLLSSGDRRSPAGRGATAEALVYVERKTGEAYLQGWFE